MAQVLCGNKVRVPSATRRQHKPDSKARRQSKLCKQATQPPNLCFTSESEDGSTLMSIAVWTCSLAFHSTTDAVQQPQRCCDDQAATERTGHDLINSATGQPAAAPQAGLLQPVSQSARPASCAPQLLACITRSPNSDGPNGDGIAVLAQGRLSLAY